MSSTTQKFIQQRNLERQRDLFNKKVHFESEQYRIKQTLGRVFEIYFLSCTIERI